MKRTLVIVSALALSLIVAACGSSSDRAPSNANGGRDQSGPGSNELFGGQPAGLYLAVTDAIVSGQVERLIVRTAQVRMEVDDVQASAALVEAVAADVGGYVQASDITGLPDKPTASITVRVPSDQFNEAMQRLRDLAETVLSEETDSQDVTEEYVDLSARLRNQQAVEQELTALLDRAANVSDVLSVQRELTRVREEIEKLQGRIQYLEQSASQSTITVRLSPSGANVRLTEAWRPDNTFRGAVSALTSLGRGLANFGIVAGVFAPIWVPLGIAGVWVYRRQARSSWLRVPQHQAPQQAHGNHEQQDEEEDAGDDTRRG